MIIKAHRITLSGNIPYQDVTIYLDEDTSSFPNLFEDSQLVFKCKSGTFMLPDYSVIIIHLKRGRIAHPGGAVKVKRILLSDDLNYPDCYVVEQQHWDRYGIPQVFRRDEQLAFICKEGLFICPDFRVRSIQL